MDEGSDINSELSNCYEVDEGDLSLANMDDMMNAINNIGTFSTNMLSKERMLGQQQLMESKTQKYLDSVLTK